MAFIYGIKNKTNNLWYVGQTRKDPKIRFRAHRKAHSSIGRAIKKDGVQNFDFLILEECDEYSLNEKEKEWILKLDSFDNGYNQTLGGDSLKGGRFLIPYSYDEVYRYYLENPNKSLREIERDLGLGHKTVSEIICLYETPRIFKANPIILSGMEYELEFKSFAAAAAWLHENNFIKSKPDAIRKGLSKAEAKNKTYYDWKVSKVKI
jgi:hypothetical protein